MPSRAANPGRKDEAMKTLETLDAIRNANRTVYFLMMRVLKQHVTFLEQCVNDEVINGDNNPDNTVKRFVGEIGKTEAEVVIASLINASAWDGRIDKGNAAWAAGVEDAFSEEAAMKLRMTTEIHRTHLNAVATAMRGYK